MRDPKRIDTVLAALRDAWARQPDLRFGQLINAACDVVMECDPFYVEDDELIAALYEMQKRWAS